MKKILIALDYSPAAQKVAEQGHALGKAMKAKIVILHVIEDIEYYSSSIYDPIMGFSGIVNTNFLSNDAVEIVAKETSNYLEKTKVHLNDEEIETVVQSGSIADTILNTAKATSADIIVIGTNIRNGLEDLILGNTAKKLIKTSTIPMFIIPIKSDYK